MKSSKGKRTDLTPREFPIALIFWLQRQQWNISWASVLIKAAECKNWVRVPSGAPEGGPGCQQVKWQTLILLQAALLGLSRSEHFCECWLKSRITVSAWPPSNSVGNSTQTVNQQQTKSNLMFCGLMCLFGGFEWCRIIRNILLVASHLALYVRAEADYLFFIKLLFHLRDHNTRLHTCRNTNAQMDGRETADCVKETEKWRDQRVSKERGHTERNEDNPCDGWINEIARLFIDSLTGW